MTNQPDLADAIQGWLLQYSCRRLGSHEWILSTKRTDNKEFKQMYPNIDPAVLSIGTLSGWGWILQIYPNRIESFQVLPWGGDASEEYPLMAADPQFFEKLETLMHLIEDYRIRERAQRRNI